MTVISRVELEAFGRTSVSNFSQASEQLMRCAVAELFTIAAFLGGSLTVESMRLARPGEQLAAIWPPMRALAIYALRAPNCSYDLRVDYLIQNVGSP